MADTEAAKPPKPDRTWLYVGAAFVVGWGLFLYFFGGGLITQETREDVLAGLPKADYNWPLMDLDDRPLLLSDYRGKTIFLNIWATWCGPCVAEMPSIAKLAGDPRLKDVAFLCISTEDSSKPIKSFLADKKWPMTILRTDAGPAVFHTEGIPATFIISPDGTIASTTLGSADWDKPEVVNLLLELLKSKPVGAAKDEAKTE